VLIDNTAQCVADWEPPVMGVGGMGGEGGEGGMGGEGGEGGMGGEMPEQDAQVDATVVDAGTGTTPDTGTTRGDGGGGDDCSTVPGSTPNSPLWALLLLAPAALQRRRTRR
jgi:uncharacterized protein (TIGR03382 family)